MRGRAGAGPSSFGRTQCLRPWNNGDMTSAGDHLNDRYGVSNSPSRRRWARLAIAAVATVFLAVVLWVAWVFVTGDPVKANTLGYHHVSDTEVRVDFSVTMTPGTEARCGVEALNENRGQVGFTVAHIGPQTEYITTHSIVVTTQQDAVAGAVKTCEVADADAP